MELEVVWSGAMKDPNGNHVYLCIPPPEVRDLSHVQPMVLRGTPGKRLYRTRMDRGQMRQQIRAVLRQRGTMTTKDLRKCMADKDPQFYNVVTRMVRHGML